MKKNGFVLTLVSVVIFMLTTNSVSAEKGSLSTLAEQSIENYATSIYQVRIMNEDSKSQNSLGSGFFIGDGSLLATNYHVVSSVVLKPEKNYAVITIDGIDKRLEVRAIDVIHDLAILSSSETAVPEPLKAAPITLSKQTPPKGARLYSIGNPLDIGLTIVEGNYNGLVDHRFFDQIHFSGAINAGMSGGPTLDSKGEVVGINVASAGNQVGFLVPVDKLIKLLDSIGKDSDVVATEKQEISSSQIKATILQQSIGKQIQMSTHFMIDELLSREWPLEELGNAIVIGKAHEAIDCWGDSDTNNKSRITRIIKGCNSRDQMFVSRSLRSGYIEYEFSYREVTDWPSSSFYKNATQSFSHADPGNRAGSKDVDNYSCVDNVIQIDQDSIKRKIVYCTRPYILFAGLFDSFYMAVSIDRDDKVIMEHFTLSGVNREDAERFLNHFIKQVDWK